METPRTIPQEARKAIKHLGVLRNSVGKKPGPISSELPLRSRTLMDC